MTKMNDFSVTKYHKIDNNTRKIVDWQHYIFDVRYLNFNVLD